MSDSNIMLYQQFVHLFQVDLLCLKFSSALVICRYFFWIAPGDVDLHFSLTLVRKANAVEEGTRWAAL